jgi:hypothetical protein
VKHQQPSAQQSRRSRRAKGILDSIEYKKLMHWPRAAASVCKELELLRNPKLLVPERDRTWV